MIIDKHRSSPQIGQVWQHYKGGRYEIVGLASMEADGEPVVMYRATPLTDGRVFVRTYGEFMSTAPPQPGGTACAPDYIHTDGWRFARLIAQKGDDGRVSG